MSRIGLGIDVGGSATRWTLVAPDGAVLGSGDATPFTGHIFSPAAEANVSRILNGLSNDVLTRGQPGCVFAGVTGLSASTPPADFVRGVLAGALGLPREAVTVCGDTYLAYRAVFEPGEGILVYAGTGSIATVAHGPDEGILVGGKGNLLDDAGSAFWIAARALRRVLRAEEAMPGSGWSSPVGTRLAAVIGGTDWPSVRAYVYAGDRGRVAMLAREVGEAASAGDIEALRLIEAAGRELARLANVLVARAGARPVALAGSASRIHPALFASFRAAVEADVEVFEDRSDAGLAAARLAAGLPAR